MTKTIEIQNNTDFKNIMWNANMETKMRREHGKLIHFKIKYHKKWITLHSGDYIAVDSDHNILSYEINNLNN